MVFFIGIHLKPLSKCSVLRILFVSARVFATQMMKNDETIRGILPDCSLCSLSFVVPQPGWRPRRKEYPAGNLHRHLLISIAKPV